MVDIVLMDGQVLKDCRIVDEFDSYFSICIPACGCGILTVSRSVISHIVER